MIHAEKLEERSSAIERAKWELLHESERKAMNTIESLLESTQSESSLATSSTTVAGRLRQTSSAARHLVILQPELNPTQDRVIDKSDLSFIRAKAYLLRSQCMDRGSIASPSEIIEGYRQATVECEHWERSYYLAGQYYLKLFDASRFFKDSPPNYAYVLFVVVAWCSFFNNLMARLTMDDDGQSC
jgi:serine/threonine-protein kinase ATR